MPNAMIIRQAELARISHNIETNRFRYEQDDPWLGEYFAGEEWALRSTIEVPDVLDLRLPTSKTDLYDLENTKALYSALRHLTPVQASDDRLWAYFTHVTFWKYMRQRWPAEQYSAGGRFRESIQERYLFMSDRPRALIRNGIARLWWYGHTSFDPQREDPFELTAVLLKNLDVTQSILERAFSRNLMVTRAVLSALADEEKAGRPFYVREKVRDLAKYLVQIGGVTIIDALDFSDVRALVLGKIAQLTAAGQ